MFSVSPPTYFVIYSEKYALYLGKFWSRVWSVPGPPFRLPLIAKRCAGDEVEKFAEKNLCRNCFINKVAGAACNFIKKEAPAQMFSYELCKILNNTYFEEHLRTAASTFSFSSAQTAIWSASFLWTIYFSKNIWQSIIWKSAFYVLPVKV